VLELIQAIVVPVAKALSVSDVSKGRDRKQFREIGTELFVFYNSANELVAVCHTIVEEIKRGCSWMQQNLSEGKPEECFFTDLPFWMGVLTASLLKTVHSIHRLGLRLRIINRGAYLPLIPLIHGKFMAIGHLVQSAGDEDCCLVVYDEQLLQSAIERFVDAAWADDQLKPRRLLRQFMGQDVQRQMIDKATRTVVTEISRIRASRHAELRNYLNDEQPRERLTATENALNKLRVVLEKNFSLADVLLDVGDIRACPKDRWAGSID
jgi:hypothetical protein